MQRKNLITKYIALLLVLVTLISNLVVVGFGANPSVNNKPVSLSRPLSTVKSAEKKEQFVVSFIDTEKGTITKPQGVISGTNVLVPNEPVFAGSALEGWYLTDTNIVSATDSYRFDFENTIITTDTNLYAHWDDSPVTLIFEMCGHGEDIPYIIVAKNHIVKEPEVKSTPEWSFVGWYRDSSYNEEFDFNEPLNETTTIYAKWKQASFEVRFSIGGKIVNSLTQYVEEGGAAKSPNYNPTNIIFDGVWYSDKTCTKIYDFYQEITSDITIYGKAKAKVKYEMNGHGTPIEDEYVDIGGFAHNPGDPVASGYVFNGWYKNSNFKEKWIFALYTVDENITLYAKWSAIPPAPAPSGRGGGGGGGGTPKEKYQIETDVEKIFGNRSDLTPFTKEVAILEGQGSFVEHYPDGSLVNFSAVIYGGKYNIDTDPIIIHVIDKFTTIYDYNFVNENTPQDIIDNLKLAYEEILSPGFAEKIIPELKKEYRKTTPRVNIDLKPEDIVISDLLEINMDDFYNNILNSTPNAYVHFGVNASSSEEDSFYAVMHRDMETGSWLVANIYALEQEEDNITLLKLDFDTMCPTIILRLTDSGKNKVLHYFDNPPVVVPVPGTEIEIDVPELVVETTKTVSLMLLYIIIIVLIVTMIRYYQYRREGKLDKFRPRLVAANMKVDILDWYKYELPQYRKNVVEWIATTKARFQRTVSSKATYASLNTVDSTKDLGDSLKLVPLKVKKFFVTTAHRILESIKISKQRAEYRKANDTLLFKDKILLAVLGFCAWVVGLVHKLLERIKVKREKKKESNKLTLWQWIKLGFYTIVIWGIDLVHKFLELCRKSSINKSKKKSQAESKPEEDKITFKNKVKLFFYEVAAWVLEVVEKLLGLFK